MTQIQKYINVTLAIIVFTLFANFTSNAQCLHTFTAIDSYGDGWNGASVNVTVNGIDVHTGAAAAGSSDDFSFNASSGDVIDLANWVSGSYDSEISWAITDGGGLVIASGAYGASGASAGSCPSGVLGCTDATTTGLTAGVGYQVTVTDANGCTATTTGIPLSIGDTYQGGIIFYLDGNGGGLIAAPTDQGQAEWGCYGTSISGATGTAIGTGAQNTIAIEAGCTTPGTAADICANLTLGGYSDWFLPSKDELNQMNVNSALIGIFANNNYWSSTEWHLYALSHAWVQFFDPMVTQYGLDKSSTFLVRAVRAF